MLTTFKSEPIWGSPCAGSSPAVTRLGQTALLSGAADARPRPAHAYAYGALPLSDVQRIQARQQGWTVSFRGVENLDDFEGDSPIARTAPMGAKQNGVSGPYTWRQPV